jgi:hypothetical protein
MTNTNEVAVKMVLDLWNSRIKATDDILNKLIRTSYCGT